MKQVEGNKDPLCGYTEGRVTLNKTCKYIIVKVTVSGTTLYVTGNHVMYYLANQMTGDGPPSFQSQPGTQGR